ncbi:hypothetical protein [Gulosibacter molinativorax]|uniref:hypothetical protein n=1 Tax=Gulosibacter molinativorax TaxID=256821 RepID=UPI0011B1C9C5|nr:hypothetical protein [Gulosibacter molinativorax]
MFNDGADTEHPLSSMLAHLHSTRTVGVGPGNGYAKERPNSVTLRYAYDRDIIRAIESLGGFFPDESNPKHWTGLGDVDVIFLDGRGHVIGATVTHEGMLIGEIPFTARDGKI